MAEEASRVVYEEQTPSEPITKPEEAQAVESTDRTLFGLIKEDKENDELVSDFETKAQVSEKVHQQVIDEVHVSETVDHQHQQVMEELQHDSHSSSSSDEEGDDEEKKKKKKEKKGLTEKIKEKLQGSEVEEEKVEYREATNIPAEVEEEKVEYPEATNIPPEVEEEKVEYREATNVPREVEEEKVEYREATNIPIEKVEEEYSSEPQPEEKKGLLEKIKDKLPGKQKKTETDDVEPVSATIVTPEVVVEPTEKKGLMDKIKEKIPGYHSKNTTEE